MLRRIPTVAPVLAGAILLAASPSALAAHKHHRKGATVKVMTRNVFLGADLPPLAVAAPGAEFQRAAGALLDEVKGTDPDARMKLVGREIAGARPDLVGLQEVSLWRTGPIEPAAAATHTRWNFLAAIQRELRRRHARYHVVAKHLGLNVEGPTDQGVDVRLTLGDVLLARRGVRVRRPRTGVFAHQLVIPTQALGPVNTSRTWNEVDAKVGGRWLHVVNTHLEAYTTDTRLQQARELVAGPLHSRRTTILLGDLNSGPTLENPDDRPPYQAIAGAGFHPERTARDSCCFTDLRGDAGWDHNVDWIMSRPRVKLVRSFVTGRERTASGVHPSDHGGVVSVLRVKRRHR